MGQVPFEVWYLTDHGIQPSPDREFGKTFSWDIDMLSGYPHRFIETAEGASPVTFWKCRLRERLRDRLRRSGAKALWIQGWQVAAYWQAVREAEGGRRRSLVAWGKQRSRPDADVETSVEATGAWPFVRARRSISVHRSRQQAPLSELSVCPNSRLYSAPYAVDNDRFARASRSLFGRNEWNSVVGGEFDDDAFCVCSAENSFRKSGRWIWSKRPASLRADGRLPNIHLLFVGSGELDRQLRQACDVVYDAEMPGVRDSLSFPMLSLRLPLVRRRPLLDFSIRRKFPAPMSPPIAWCCRAITARPGDWW